MPAKGRVLVIEDTPSIRHRVALWLKKEEHPHTFVNTDEEAAELLRHVRFDAVMYGHEFVFSSEIARSLPDQLQRTVLVREVPALFVQALL